MDATARDFFQSTSANTNGLNDLFEVREANTYQVANQAVRTPDANQAGRVLDAYQTASISVEEAAERLGISVRAVQKRLQKGNLAGVKIQTANGPRWLVSTSELNENQDVRREPTKNPNVIEIQGIVRELDANQVQNKLAELLKNTADPKANLSTLFELLEKKDRELEAASYRIGYLEAQLEKERKQLMMLTDKQHNSRWWTKLNF